MPRTKNTVLVRTLENRFRMLGPRISAQWVATQVGQQTEFVVRRSTKAGRINHKNLIVVVQRNRSLIDVQADALPVILWPGDDRATARQRPWIFHRRDHDNLIAANPDRIQKVVVAIELQDAAINRPAVIGRIKETRLIDIWPHRVHAFALQHVRMLEIIRAFYARRVVEIPARAVRAIKQMELRSPEITAARGIGFKVNALRFGRL